MPDFLIFSGILPWIFGSKVVLDVHDPMSELYISTYHLAEHHWFIKVIRLQEKLSYAFPCLLVTVNESMRERIIRSGVPPEKVIVIFNSPNLALFKVAKDPKGSSGSQDFSLVYSGTIAQRYGLDIAIRAMALLKREMPDLKLVIVGDGNYLASLDELAIQLGVRDCVEFRGKVPFSELLEILVVCDAGLSPHRSDCFWDLYFSTKILEYFAVGLPVISSRTRTIEAYLGDSVFYFCPEDVEGLADQIRLLRIRPAVTQAKKALADQILSELSWENEKKKLHQLVLELTEPNDRRKSTRHQE
jgi:glycosyltransferase involved in cell wall biosynthesis